MCKLRQRHAERLEEEDVLRRVGEVVLAADHVGDPHIRVVYDHGEVVERRTIRAEDHEIASECLSVDLDPTADKVINDHNARPDAEPQGGRLPRRNATRRILCRDPRASARVSGRELRLFARTPLRIKFRASTEAVVRKARCVELRRNFGVARAASRLPVWTTPSALLVRADDTLVRFKPEPAQPLKDVCLVFCS